MSECTRLPNDATDPEALAQWDRPTGAESRLTAPAGLSLVEIMYEAGPDGRPVEVSREPIDKDCIEWRGSVPVAIVGPGSRIELEPNTTCEYSKFAIVGSTSRWIGYIVKRAIMPGPFDKPESPHDPIAGANQSRGPLSPICIDTSADGVSRIHSKRRWSYEISDKLFEETKQRADEAEERAHKAEAIVKMLANCDDALLQSAEMSDLYDAADAAIGYLATRPLLPEHQTIVEKIADYYGKESNGAGGLCHIVLDDHNIADDHLEYCARTCAKSADGDGVALMGLLKPLPIWLRRRIVQAEY